MSVILLEVLHVIRHLVCVCAKRALEVNPATLADQHTSIFLPPDVQVAIVVLEVLMVAVRMGNAIVRYYIKLQCEN